MHSLIAFLAMSSNQKEMALKHFQLALEAKPENESFIKLCISFAKGAPLDPSFSNEESVPLNAITHLISGYAQFSQKDHDSAKYGEIIDTCFQYLFLGEHFEME